MALSEAAFYQARRAAPRAGRERAVQSLVPEARDHPALAPLRRRLAEEEAAYAAALAALDRLSRFVLPEEERPGLLEAVEDVNAAAAAPSSIAPRGAGAVLARRLIGALRPLFDRQKRLDDALVRLLNELITRQARLNGCLRGLAAGLVHYAQRVEPLMDSRDALRVSEAPSDAVLVLETFERRLDGAQTQVAALLALRDRVELLSEELRALRRGLEGAAVPAELARAAGRAAADSAYTAFEDRFRGPREAIRARQADYVALFRESAPVLDLGCGRGEFLDLLRAEGIQARGVEGNAGAVAECRAKGLDVLQGEVVAVMQAQPGGSVGGVFAAQLVEHLPPAALAALLRASHDALRPGGVLVLETVNAASALAFLDVFVRDLTHERPLHPETLRFMAAAAGFSEARIELRSPVPDDVRLQLLPSGALPPPVTKVLNENAERLNALLFAPLDYALIGRR